MDEIRILLDEGKFEELCNLGFTKYGNSEISISQENFDQLIDGDVVSVIKSIRTRHKSNTNVSFKIALQDIGYDRIYFYLNKSKIYK